MNFRFRRIHVAGPRGLEPPPSAPLWRGTSAPSTSTPTTSLGSQPSRPSFKGAPVQNARRCSWRQSRAKIAGCCPARFLDRGDELMPLLDLVVFLHIPPESGFPRLLARERARYGAKIDPGGTQYKSNQAFMLAARGFKRRIPGAESSQCARLARKAQLPFDRDRRRGLVAGRAARSPRGGPIGVGGVQIEGPLVDTAAT